MIYFIIVIIIVIAIIAAKSASNTGSAALISNNDEVVIAETVNYIEQVRLLFVGESALDDTTLGWFQIIPVNENKEMNHKNSSIVMLRILLYDDCDWKVPFILNTAQINDSSFGNFFHLEQQDNLKLFIAYTSCHFSSDYRIFMQTLYNEVNVRFPNTFRFSNFQLVAGDQYGKRIF